MVPETSTIQLLNAAEESINFISENVAQATVSYQLKSSKHILLQLQVTMRYEKQSSQVIGAETK